ncbi:FecR family protein [Bacteroidales bacterium 6E]|nr:FecR family protein [Bacteroidales bacterium 6E]
MKTNKHIKKSDSIFIQFIEYRKSLTPFEMKMEAAKLINQTDSVDLNKAYHNVYDKINLKTNFNVIYTTLTRIAAVLTLPLLAFTIWSLFFQDSLQQSDLIARNNISIQEIHSPIGMRSYVVLPDSTCLWLNSGSYLRYGIPFIRENRVVELIGEAFLDVARNDDSPFVVKANGAEVEVLGTRFNVNAWPNSNVISVVLKEGSINFKFQVEEGIFKRTELKPNDYLQFDTNDNKIAVENTNIEKYIAWHQNIMILDDTPMTELAEMLSKWYGVRVVIASEEIKRYKFTTTFDNEPLHRVLELLEISSPGIKFHYSTGKPIEGTKQFTLPLITITKK